MENRDLANFAIGTRISQLDGKEFKKQIDSLTKQKVNHEENIKRFKDGRD